ncbi:hypothetical protein [Escherichia coli]|uniref:hypothetical protein n=1 Tax=Escherichia coli TaxID=562 RepID=UPI003D80A883
MNLKGYDYPDIQRAVLAEKADAPLIQWDATSATLKALGCHNIDRALDIRVIITLEIQQN